MDWTSVCLFAGLRASMQMDRRISEIRQEMNKYAWLAAGCFVAVGPADFHHYRFIAERKHAWHVAIRRVCARVGPLASDVDPSECNIISLPSPPFLLCSVEV